jgi:predicted ATP-dependent protease
MMDGLPTPDEPQTPAAIRALRGDRSRAHFARLVGVTPNTVYRWELPEDAKEARRPRAGDRAQLARLARDSAERAVTEPAETDRDRWSSEPMAPELSAMESRILRLFSADHEGAYAELLGAVATPLARTERALAAAGLALHAALRHFDGERALVALAPALRVVLEPEPPGRLSSVDAIVGEWTFGAAAILHALPQKRLFDLGKLQDFASSAVRASDVHGGSVGRLLAACALNAAAATVGDEALAERAFRLLPRVSRGALPELLSAHLDEIHAFRMLLRGEMTAARSHLEAVAEAAERLQCRPLEARALGCLAVRHLDDLADPETALAIAARSRRAAERGRLGGGIHDAFATRAELEALLRRGAVDDAVARLGDLDRATEELGFPPFPALTAVARVLLFAGRYDDLESRASALRGGDSDGASNPRTAELHSSFDAIVPIADAYATYFEALAIYGRGGSSSLLLATFAEAEAKAARWRLLLRDVLVYGTGALLACGRFDEGEQSLRRTQRLLDRLPSPWAIAHSRRLEGTVLAARGDWTSARTHIEAAIAAFEVARDSVDATLARWLFASLAAMNGEVLTGDASLEARRAAFLPMGLVLPATVESGLARQQRLHDARLRGGDGSSPHLPTTTHRFTAARLVVPVSRLTVRGGDRRLIERELLAVLGDLLAPRVFRIEEIDSAGAAVAGHGAPLPSVASWVEFGDGTGRRMRIGTAGVVEDDTRAAMTVLAHVASLALEVATVRGLGVEHVGESRRRLATAAEEDEGDYAALPSEFIAFSPTMRKLRKEVTTVATSKATVVVTGESGSGKEVVARALHSASPRKTRPFVTFNCATVPRDLFEGQLFGFKRGAFTGATADHAGVIRTADRGTLFLDEIGELPLDVQPKLLRFLENQEIVLLGASRAIPVDVRVVAATHRDLGALVRAGAFREDLFFRLQVVALSVPPLRERREDILPLARHFLERFGGHEHPVLLTDDAATRLLAHRYTGNVRELRNILERTLAHAPEMTVLRADALRMDLERDRERE